jgi:transcriptional regulator with GAF, ATPase, and Fis domain
MKMAGVQTKLLRHPGLGKFARELERHLDHRIESMSPSQLVELVDQVSLGLLREAFREVGGCEGTIWLFDGGPADLVAVFNSGEDPDSLVGFRQPLGQGIISLVFTQQQPYCENDIQASEGHDDTLDRKISRHTTAMIAVPFYFGFGLRGVISCVQLRETKHESEGFSFADVETLTRVANLVERLINESLFSSALGLNDGF